MASDFDSYQLRADSNMGRIVAREFFGKPAKGGCLTSIAISTSRTFGPFPVPDDQHILRFKVARCTTLRPGIWSSASTIVRVTGTLMMAGATHEAFTPDTFAGGIGNDKFNAEAAWSTVQIGPCPKLCTVCGNRFHPSIDYSRSLLHSTIAMNNGQSLPNGGAVNDYKLRIVPNDEVVFTRTFHDPALTPVLLENRTVSILVELVSGPDLISEFALEVV